MARKYFTLCTRTDGKWSPQFGDYDRAVVAQEADDSYWNNGIKEEGKFSKKDMKIISTGARQADIDAGVANLNNERRPGGLTLTEALEAGGYKT
jgi:hypothetical protein